MENLGSERFDGSSSSDATQANRQVSIQSCIDSLIHSCQCRDAICQEPSCKKMKQVVQHTKICKRRTDGVCPICMLLVADCCHHAKHCLESKCRVSCCLLTKLKLKQQKLKQRLQKDLLLSRRLAAWKTNILTAPIGTPTPTPVLPSPVTSPQGPGVIVATCGTAAGTGQQNKQASQQLLKKLETPNTPEQQHQIMQILQSNPQLMAKIVKQYQMYQQSQQDPGVVPSPQLHIMSQPALAAPQQQQQQQQQSREN